METHKEPTRVSFNTLTFECPFDLNKSAQSVSEVVITSGETRFEGPSESIHEKRRKAAGQVEK